MDRRHLLALLSSGAFPALAYSQGGPKSPLKRHPSESAKGTIVLGQTADFSASRSLISKAYAEGSDLVFQEVNASGGVHGRRIQVLLLDDGYDIKRAEDNVRALNEQHKVFALVHLVGTGIVDRVLPYVGQAGIPLVHPITGADNVRPPARHVREAFFLRASYGREVDRIASHLATLGIDKVSLLIEDEPFGHSVRNNVEAAVEKHKLNLVATGVIPPNQPTAEAVAPAVKSLLKAHPKVILFGSAGPVVEKFVRAYHEAGGRAQFYCLSVANVERLVRDLGSLSEGIVVAQVMPDVRSSNLPVVRDYREAAAKRGTALGVFGLEGYLSARVIVQALRDAGEPATRARFIAGLERQSQVGGFPVKYQDARQGSPFVELSMIGRRGKSVR
ncbi:ABC transporter substrate-binding protein [Hydrogenophaga sp.]|uniref:ABC transporter substrate-binding protein n=1 Tax=Hydrogenophaga sp. TaxID=1904254 RepID=UPI002FCA5F00